jgi:arginase family enzyme
VSGTVDREELSRVWREAAGPPAPSVPSLGPTTLMGAPLASPDELLGADLAVLGLPIGAWQDAPAAVRTASRRYSGWLAAAQAESGVRVADYGDVAVDAADAAVTFLRAHERIADVLAAGAAPLVLGGDSLVTVPVLQVLAGKLRGRLGVIAFSPRLDLDLEAADTGSGRWMRALELGLCTPQNVVLIGDRGAPDEAQARRAGAALGVRGYGLADIAEAGVVTVAREALESACAGTEAVYVSVDLGVAEGLSDPAGLSAGDLSVALGLVAAARLAAVDVCGVDRAAGSGGAALLAARLAADIVLAVSSARG